MQHVKHTRKSVASPVVCVGLSPSSPLGWKPPLAQSSMGVIWSSGLSELQGEKVFSARILAIYRRQEGHRTSACLHQPSLNQPSQNQPTQKPTDPAVPGRHMRNSRSLWRHQARGHRSNLTPWRSVPISSTLLYLRPRVKGHRSKHH